jgi:hypothetical protein
VITNATVFSDYPSVIKGGAKMSEFLPMENLKPH